MPSSYSQFRLTLESFVPDGLQLIWQWVAVSTAVGRITPASRAGNHGHGGSHHNHWVCTGCLVSCLFVMAATNKARLWIESCAVISAYGFPGNLWTVRLS